MTDANDNISKIIYDALGKPVAMAINGKGTEGDNLTGLNIEDYTVQEDFWDDPEIYAASLLGNATMRCVYQQQQQQIYKIKQQMDRLEERFIMEEIDKEMFAKYKQKFTTERHQIEQEMAKSTNRVSNLDKCIEMAIQFSAKLPSMWGLGG